MSDFMSDFMRELMQKFLQRFADWVERNVADAAPA